MLTSPMTATCPQGSGRMRFDRNALRRGVLIGTVLLVAVFLAGVASASATRLYLAVGDSVTVGFGATPGHSFFDLYCAYLESSAGGRRVNSCVDDANDGLSSQAALGATMQTAVKDIKASTDTPVVTVDLGGIDLLSTPGCQPITGTSCPFIHNMRTILDELETALATHPGPHSIQWLEYYNPDHNNPFGSSANDQRTAELMLGSDLKLTACSSGNLTLIGFDDVVNCIAQEKGATPVDAYTPFQKNCTARDCFSDSLHPNDKGYRLIFDALKATPGSPTPRTPPADGNWPLSTKISALTETKKTFAPSRSHHKGGTVFAFRLAGPAEITISIWSTRAGGTHHRIGTLNVDGHAGPNKVAFNGYIHGRPLPPGRYVAVFKTTGTAVISTTRTLVFTIVK
jgi:lysophospholipase L1-like esterase